MGIYDRDYANKGRGMGAPPSGGGGHLVARTPDWSVTTWLIVINIAIYILSSFADVVYQVGHLSTYTGFQRLEVWRLITFQFLHSPDTITHIFFNMFGLWMFGPMVEQMHGAKKYLAFYLTCGVFGGVLFVVLNLLGNVLNVELPGLLAIDTRSPLIGASAGVFGVIVACAYIKPDMEVGLFFLPIFIKMKWAAYGYVAFSLFNLLRGSANAGGEAAHIGGAIAGYIFIRNTHLLTDFFDVFGDSREPKKSKKSKKKSALRNYKNTDGPHPDEIDAILDKVHKKGFASLSEKDKKKLREASRDA